MATNITPLNFSDGAQINVVRADGAYTWVTTAICFDDNGVTLDYHEGAPTNTDYRLFLPWHSIDRIYQEL